MAIYEAVFNLMEGIVPEYDRKRVVRQPSGSTVTGIVPTNTYLCADGKYVVIGGNGDSIYRHARPHALCMCHCASLLFTTGTAHASKSHSHAHGRRLMEAAGRADLAEDPRLATNVGRVAHQVGA